MQCPFDTKIVASNERQKKNLVEIKIRNCDEKKKTDKNNGRKGLMPRHNSTSVSHNRNCLAICVQLQMK